MFLQPLIERTLRLCGVRSSRLHRHAHQFTKFALVGLFNTVLHLSLLHFFVQVGSLSKLIANMLAGALAMLSAYLLNKFLTFRNTEKKHMQQGFKFLLVYSSSYCFGQIGLFWLFAVYWEMYYLLATLLIIPITMVWNYLWLHLHVFKKPATTPA